MATITPTLTTFPGRQPGNGLCLFFYDAQNEFFYGGIGSALGYAPYTGDMAFGHSSVLTSTVLYTSDFSSDVDGWTATVGTVTRVASYDGEANVLKYVPDTISSSHLISHDVDFVLGKKYRISGKYSIADNTVMRKIAIYHDGGGQFYTGDEAGAGWTEFDEVITADSDTDRLAFYGIDANGVASFTPTADESFGIKDIVITEVDQGTMNGMARAHLGIGFDVKGDFGNTSDLKTGATILGTENYTLTSCAIDTRAPNTITTRAGELSAYRVLSTTPNLSTYPLSGSPDETYGEPNVRYTDSPPITLHQSVTSRDDVVFHRVKVTLQNQGQRIRVEIKDPATGKYHLYQVIDTDGGLGERLMPYDGITSLKVGLAFSTSDSVMNCEIKNFCTYGTYSDAVKRSQYLQPHSTSKYRVVLDGDCP